MKVMFNRKINYLNRDFKLCIPLEYDSVYYAFNLFNYSKLAVVKKNNKYGILNQSYEEILKEDVEENHT